MRYTIGMWSCIVSSNIYTALSKVPGVDVSFAEQTSWIWFGMAMGCLMLDVIFGERK